MKEIKTKIKIAQAKSRFAPSPPNQHRAPPGVKSPKFGPQNQQPIDPINDPSFDPWDDEDKMDDEGQRVDKSRPRQQEQEPTVNKKKGRPIGKYDAAMLDPTPDGSYTKWINRHVDKGEINESNMLDVYFTLTRLYDMTILDGWYIDIETFTGVDDLFDTVDALSTDSQTTGGGTGRSRGTFTGYGFGTKWEEKKPEPNSLRSDDAPYRHTTREDYPSQQAIADYLSTIYPEEHGLEGIGKDRWGLHSDTPSNEVKKIMVATTPTEGVREEFDKGNYDLLISHHDFLIGVPQIVYHLTMDFADKGHNGYFAKRMGLQDVTKIGGLSVRGNLPKPVPFEEFTQLLNKKGFDIKGMVWQNPRRAQNNNVIKSVVFCSGMGGVTLSDSWAKGPYGLTTTKADVFVTGEITQHPKGTPNRFRYIVELGHTPSEKPVFKNVANMIKNRWKNVEVGMAGEEVDKLGEDVYVEWEPTTGFAAEQKGKKGKKRRGGKKNKKNKQRHPESIPDEVRDEVREPIDFDGLGQDVYGPYAKPGANSGADY